MKRTVLWAMAMLAAMALVSADTAKRNAYWNGSLFEDVTDASGLFYQGHGKCIALGDFDNDGDLDVYLSVVYSDNLLYQNEGNLKFVNMAPFLKVGSPYGTHGIAMADFDNNGYLDIFCANNLEALSEMRGEVLQPNNFYLGFDEGFVERAEAAGLAGLKFNYSCGVTTADVNGDGLLDIYVAKGGYRNGKECANSLYVNNGDGTYRDIAVKAGVADQGNGYCCAFSDYDNDGHPDLYVGNMSVDGEMSILYHNNGDGTFTDVTRKAGITGHGNNISCFWGDFNNDGLQDLFLANSTGPNQGENSLFINNGDGTFRDMSKESGVAIRTNSRGCTIGDVDNDGDLDIYVTNSAEESLVLINDGTGKFTDMKVKTGGSVFYGHGCALGDLDGDGDLDLIVGNWRRPAFNNPGRWKLFRNKTNNGNFLKVNVEGTVSNRSGVMTKLWVYDTGHAREKNFLRGFREVTAGNGTFPGNPLQQHFGLDAAKRYDIVARFPSGIEAVVSKVAPGQTLKIREPKGK